MKLKLIPVLVAGLLASAPAFSAVTIDFDGPTSFASIADYYNGGTDGNSVAGPVNLGVSFGGGALALQNDGTGSGTNGEFFTHAPSPIGVMTAVGSDAAMNYAFGFMTEASFSYSSSADATVGIYSGLNGTGTLLGSFTLSNNATSGCSDSAYCNWNLSTVSFSGTAHSIAFGSAANVAGFDNVTITPVPEASETLLLALGIAGVAGLTRRLRAGK